MDKLEKLLSACKCGVHLVINEHRDYYQSVEDKLEELNFGGCDPDIPDDVRAKMIETNTIIDLQFYPTTPVGHYNIYHYSLDKALDEALELIA